MQPPPLWRRRFFIQSSSFIGAPSPSPTSEGWPARAGASRLPRRLPAARLTARQPRSYRPRVQLAIPQNVVPDAISAPHDSGPGRLPTASRPGPAPRRSPPWWAVLLGTSLAGCSSLTGPPPPDVVLLVVDTLRADHVGAYGGARPTSPAIDQLAAQGVRFERAYASSPWTLPSTATILTGRAPSAHGAVRVGQRLSPAALTLPERLQDAGYSTVALSANPFVSATWGLEQGFDLFEQPLRAPGDHSSADALVRRGLELLDGECARPCLLYLHFIDPHDPYTPHEAHDFDPGPTGRLVGGEEIGVLRRLDPALQAEELAFIVASYDEEIAATDAAVGRLLGGLEARGRRNDAVIALTADHGEEFMGRGWLGHTRTLYEELLRVPLVVVAPGVAPELRTEPVGLQQLAPTLAQLAGLPSGAAPGLPLGSAKTLIHTVFSEVDFVPMNESERLKTAKKQAVIEGDWKLIRDGRGGGTELFHLATDPGERTNLAVAEPEKRAELERALDAAAALAGAAPLPRQETRMSDEEQEQLRHLGYIE